jgi:hypothetical protein
LIQQIGIRQQALGNSKKMKGLERIFPREKSVSKTRAMPRANRPEGFNGSKVQQFKVNRNEASGKK